MDLVSQYLRAVAALLPRAQRDDITAELRDIILSRIEAREATLGRPLGDAEIEEELRAVGHPILVAARYRQEPQHLVGPSLYPYWMFAVKIAIAIQLVAALAALILRTIATQDFGDALGHAIGQTVTGAVTIIGVATIAAWLIERGRIQLGTLDQWKVRDLKVLEYAGWDFTDLRNHFQQAHTTARDSRAAARTSRWAARSHSHRVSPVSRGIFTIAFGTVFLLWWTGALPLTAFAPSHGLHRLYDNLFTGTVGGMTLDDLHALLFWPGLFFIAAIIAQGVLTLAFPAAIRFRALVSILVGAATLAFCGWLWTASPIAAAISVESLAELMEEARQGVHQGLPQPLAPLLTFWLLCAAFGAIVQIVQGLWRMLAPPWWTA